MSKNTTKKTNVKNPRLYFISNSPEEDITKIKSFFDTDENSKSFFDKVYKTSATSKDFEGTKTNIFINIKMNIDLNEEDFKKVSKKFNKILEKSYKMFYIDNNNRFVYIPEDILKNINKSLVSFIND